MPTDTHGSDDSGIEIPGGFSDIDVEAALSDIESGRDTQPDPTPAVDSATVHPKPSPSASAPPAGASPSPQEVEFIWNGKPIKAPLATAVQWASQGYDYNQKMQAHKAEQAAIEQARKELEPLTARYAELEAYVDQNPDWWSHVTQQWEQRRAQPAQPGQITADHPVMRELTQLKAQIGDVLKFKNDSVAERLLTQRKQEDQALNEGIQTVRKEFADLDWSSVSPDGHSLENQVLKFAQDNSIGIKPDGTIVPSAFRQAFLLFNHDRLVKRAQDQTKEAAVKERQKHTKLGLLGTAPAPKGGITRAEDIKQKTYDDLMREGIEELGLDINF